MRKQPDDGVWQVYLTVRDTRVINDNELGDHRMVYVLVLHNNLGVTHGYDGRKPIYKRSMKLIYIVCSVYHGTPGPRGVHRCELQL